MNIELFPCSGGMSEGHRRAGITFHVAFDKDPDACASHETNLSLRPIQMDVHDLLRMVRAGWRPTGHRVYNVNGRDVHAPTDAGIDYLCADPPCTPWSRAGKREGLADPRDCLRATRELIELLRPRAYLIGNVPGLQDSTSWHVVQEVIGGLAAHGYCVVDYASLDAADYGVPQHRIRPFWFGHLDGPCIRWPAPTHGAPTGQLAIGAQALKPWVTCRDALGHLSIDELGRPVRMKIREKGEDDRKNGGDATRCSAPDRPAATVVGKDTRKGGQILIGNDHHPASRLDEPAMTVTGGRANRGAQGGRANRGAQGGRALLLREAEGHPLARVDAPAPTIRGGGEGHSAPQVVLKARTWDNHPESSLDEPGRTIKTNGGRNSRGGTSLLIPELSRSAESRHGNGFSKPDEPAATLTRNTHSEGATLEWPWDRPSTAIMRDERIQPPGHHDGGSIRSLPNAVILSERAAGILQGFPENWTFAGDTKKARWSQIGQAMPPPLAHAVAAAVAEQMRAARERAA